MGGKAPLSQKMIFDLEGSSVAMLLGSRVCRSVNRSCLVGDGFSW